MSKSRDIADSAATINYIDNVTSDVQSQINTLDTALDNISVTSGTLTKTFAQNETASISLTSSVLAPVVSVTKEVPQSGVTNNSWDVNSTTENYTRLNSAYATTLDWVGYVIADSSYDSVSFSVDSQDTSMRDITFSADGTKMFTIGEVGDAVYEYALSTAFDISTASYTQSFSVSAQEGGPQGLAFNTDGTKMFISGNNGDDVNEYTLSSAFDVSTASYSQSGVSIGNPTSLAFSLDGTKVFVTTAGETCQLNLSTAFDISTASYVSCFTTTSQDTNMTGISFNSAGTKMFLIGSTGDSVYQYSLSTAYTISTASYDSVSFSVASQSTTPNGIAFNNTGTKMYVLNQSGGTVYQYSVGINGLALGTGSFASADVGKTIEANDGVFVLTATDGSYVETTAPTSYDQVASGSWSMYGVVYNSTDGDLEMSKYSDIYNFSSRIQTGSQTFYGVVSGATSPQGIYFKPDGSRFWTVDQDKDTILQWDMSPYWSDTTLGYNYQFSISGETGVAKDITVPSPGNYIYVCSSTTVYRYTLNNGAYNLGISTSFSQSYATSAGGDGIDISHDGTKMFFVDSSSGNIKYHTMSTAYDLSTASFVGNYSPSGISTSGNVAIRFKDNGTRLLILRNNGTMYEWSLSTAYDITNASNITFVGSTAMSLPDSTTYGFDTGDNGKYFYSVGSNARFYISTIGSGVVFPTGYYSVHTTSSIDSTYWTDINSMTADQNAGDGNVYYAISTDDRTTWTVIDNTDGERDIVRNNAGTWQYNSSGTYALETWVNGTTNTELATLAEAMATAQNRMDKTQLDAVTDPNHIALGNDLDLAIVFNMTSGATVPSSDGVAINYDANVLNKGAVLGTDYDFDAPTQNSVRITALAANNLKVRVV